MFRDFSTIRQPLPAQRRAGTLRAQRRGPTGPRTDRQAEIRMREGVERARKVVENVANRAEGLKSEIGRLSDLDRAAGSHLREPLGTGRETVLPPGHTHQRNSDLLDPEGTRRKYNRVPEPLSGPAYYDPTLFLRNRGSTLLPNWVAIGAGPVVQSWLRTGVRVEDFMTTIPPPFRLPPIPVDKKDKVWLKTELDRGTTTGAFEPAECLDYVSNAFIHTQPNGKKRLVFNFKHLNKFMKECFSKYDTLKVLKNLARKGDYAISFDIQDDFHFIPIAQEDRKYLTFEIDGQLWQCAALPFGWSVSPWIFTKTMRVVVKFFRSHVGSDLDKDKPRTRYPWKQSEWRHIRDPGNLRCLPYVDDFLFLFDSYELASLGAQFIDLTLAKLGLIRSVKKSVWTPTQVIDHLGLRMDFVRGLYIVPPKTVTTVETMARTLLITAKKASGRVPLRTLARFTGTIASISLACPLARFRTRSLHDCVGSPTDWNGWTKISRAARTDLRWWEVRFNLSATSRAIWESTAYQQRIHVDASGNEGWGAALNMTVPAQGFWRAHQQHHIIAMKELKAVRFALQSFLPDVANAVVRLHEDNQTVLKILLSGTTRSPLMMRELRKLFELCGLHGITLRPEYIGPT